MKDAAAEASSVGTGVQGWSHGYDRHRPHLCVCLLTDGKWGRLLGPPTTLSSKVRSTCSHKPTMWFLFLVEILPSKLGRTCSHKTFETDWLCLFPLGFSSASWYTLHALALVYARYTAQHSPPCTKPVCSFHLFLLSLFNHNCRYSISTIYHLL